MTNISSQIKSYPFQDLNSPVLRKYSHNQYDLSDKSNFKENFFSNKISNFIDFLRHHRYKSDYDYSSLEDHTSFAVPTDTALYSLDFLRLINYPNLKEVSDFLFEHQDIIEVTQTGCSLAYEKFGKNGKLFLEVFHDPGDDDKYLTLTIQQKEYPDDFMNQIKEISNLFRGELVDKSAYFLITTDFEIVSP